MNSLFSNRFVNRVLHKTLWVTLLPVCALWGIGQSMTERSASPATDISVVSAELPAQWQGALLHPATDCYRGLGYRIRNERLEVQADQARWCCFVADRSGRTILRPAPGDWATNVRTGPMQIDVGVAALIQWGTTPWIAR